MGPIQKKTVEAVSFLQAHAQSHRPENHGLPSIKVVDRAAGPTLPGALILPSYHQDSFFTAGPARVTPQSRLREQSSNGVIAMWGSELVEGKPVRRLAGNPNFKPGARNDKVDFSYCKGVTRKHDNEHNAEDCYGEWYSAPAVVQRCTPKFPTRVAGSEH